jgi:hypothetical protein
VSEVSLLSALTVLLDPKNVYKPEDAHNSSKLLVSSSNPFNITHDAVSLPSVFLLLAAVVSAASVHPARRQCSEASRFGIVSITPDIVVPGDVREHLRCLGTVD